MWTTIGPLLVPHRMSWCDVDAAATVGNDRMHLPEGPAGTETAAEMDAVTMAATPTTIEEASAATARVRRAAVKAAETAEVTMAAMPTTIEGGSAAIDRVSRVAVPTRAPAASTTAVVASGALLLRPRLATRTSFTLTTNEEVNVVRAREPISTTTQRRRTVLHRLSIQAGTVLADLLTEGAVTRGGR